MLTSKRCPVCGTAYPASLAFCTADGTPLEAMPETPRLPPAVAAAPAKAASQLPWVLAGGLGGALVVALVLLWAGRGDASPSDTAELSGDAHSSIVEGAPVSPSAYVPRDALPDAVDFSLTIRCAWGADRPTALREAPRPSAPITGEIAAGASVQADDVRAVVDRPGQMRILRAVEMDAVTLGPKLDFDPPGGTFTTLPYRAGESFEFVRVPDRNALYVVGRQFIHSIDATAYASTFSVMSEPSVTRWLHTDGGWVHEGALQANSCQG